MMDPHEQKALDNIAEYGCHVLHVFEEGDLPQFTYSVGIQQTTGHPEIIVTGLKREIAHWIVNEYKDRVRAGEHFEEDGYYPGFLEGFDVTFKKVLKNHYQEYFGWNLWLYDGPNFDVLQLIWPGTSGTWHWESDASDYLKWSIPNLYERTPNEPLNRTAYSPLRLQLAHSVRRKLRRLMYGSPLTQC